MRSMFGARRFARCGQAGARKSVSDATQIAERVPNVGRFEEGEGEGEEHSWKTASRLARTDVRSGCLVVVGRPWPVGLQPLDAAQLTHPEI